MKKIEKKANGKRMLMMQFATLAEMRRYITTTPVDEGWNRDHTKERLSYEFNGAHTFEEACEQLTKGKHVAELKRAINRGKVGYGKPRPQLSIAGGCPNVSAYVAGSPACMYKMAPTKKPGAYDIYVDVAVHFGISKEQMYNAGLEILIKVMQASSKYPINLYVGSSSNHNDRYLGFFTKIMDAGKPFNVARVSYALTEPGFFRVFNFCLIERNGGFWSNRARSGYGRPTYEYERKEFFNEIYKNTPTKDAILLSTGDVIKHHDRALEPINAIL